MTQLPDADWWTTVEFTLGERPPGGKGFAMSREDMIELFKLATSMRQLVNEQFAAQRAMIDIIPPAEDPASHTYLGDNAEGTEPVGARAAGESYTTRLQEQANYLDLLIAKLTAVLEHVEGLDNDRASDIDAVYKG